MLELGARSTGAATAALHGTSASSYRGGLALADAARARQSADGNCWLAHLACSTASTYGLAPWPKRRSKHGWLANPRRREWLVFERG
jgi:hypothetical protein